MAGYTQTLKYAPYALYPALEPLSIVTVDWPMAYPLSETKGATSGGLTTTLLYVSTPIIPEPPNELRLIPWSYHSNQITDICYMYNNPACPHVTTHLTPYQPPLCNTIASLLSTR